MTWLLLSRKNVPSLSWRFVSGVRLRLGLLTSRLGLTITIGLIGLWIPVYFALANTLFGEPQISLVWYIVGAVLSLILIWMIAALVALHRLPAEGYAEIAVANRNVSEVWQIVSFEIWKICAGFIRNKSVGVFGTEFIRLLNDGIQPISKSNKLKLEKMHKRLLAYSIKQQRSVDLVWSLKRRAASLYGIPARRLCDYVFQFSPAIYQDRIGK